MRAWKIEAQRKMNGKFTIVELERHLAAYIGIDERAVRILTPDFRMAVNEDGVGLTLTDLRSRWEGHNHEVQMGEKEYWGKIRKNSPNNWRDE
jgi:hypothetical protein